MFRQRLLIAAVGLALAGGAWGNPLNPQVAAGSARFSTQGSVLTVTNTPGTVINWQGFSIASGELTRFVQASAASQVLNRVTGGSPSVILGSLQSNGQVFLINPNGVAFGTGARVDVAGLVVSSLTLSNADFAAGTLRFGPAAAAGAVTNAGTIVAGSGGRILLVAPEVRNDGRLEAPDGSVTLAAGGRVLVLDSTQPDVQVELDAGTAARNLGQILGSRVGMYGGLVEQAGLVQASRASVGTDGVVRLRASDTALVSGTVQAAGGTVDIVADQVGLLQGARVDVSAAAGGGHINVGRALAGSGGPDARMVYVDAGAVLSADAGVRGDGGQVSVYASDTARIYGQLSARGGALGGAGGLVETSGERGLDIAGIRVDASAPAGADGRWLIDPNTVTVVHGTVSPISGGMFGPLGGATQIGDTDINTALGTGNVTIQTSGGTGNVITINTGVAISNTSGSARSLSFVSGDSITLSYGASITATSGALSVSFTTAGSASPTNVNGSLSLGGGTLSFSGGNLALGANATIANATLSAAAGTSLSLSGATLTSVSFGSSMAVTGNASIQGDLLLAPGTAVTLSSGNWDFTSSGTQNLALGAAGSATLTLGNSSLRAYNNVTTLAIGQGVTVNGYGSISQIYASATVANSGTVSASTAGQTLTVNTTGFTNTATGTFGASGGTLNLSPTTWSNAGQIAVSAGTLDLGGSFTRADLAGITRTGGNVYITGSLNLQGGSLDVGATGPFGAGGLTAVQGGQVSNGTLLSGDATPLALTSSPQLNGVTLGGTLTLTGGEAQVSGTLGLTPGAQVTVSGSYLDFNSAGTQGISMSAAGSGTLTLANGSLRAYNNVTTLAIGQGVTVNGYGSISQVYASATVANSGTVSASTAGQTLTVNTTGFTNTATGTFGASGGTLNLTPVTSWSNAGQIAVSAGTLDLGGSFTRADLAGITRSGGNVYITGSVDLQGGSLDVGATGPFGAGGLTAVQGGQVSNGTLLSGDATPLRFTGSPQVTGVGLAGTLGITGETLVNGTLTLVPGAQVNVSGYLDFNSAGTQTIALGAPGAATLTLAGGNLRAYNNVTTLAIGQGVTINGYGGISQVYASATVANSGTVTASSSGQTLTVNTTGFTNTATGTFGASGGTLNLAPTTWSNAGQIAVSAGTLDLGGSFTLADLAGITRTGGNVYITGSLNLQGGSLDVGATGPFGAGGLTAVQSGTLTGGTVVSGDGVTKLNFTGSPVLRNVTIGSNLTSTGTTDVSGNLTLAAGVRYDIGNGIVYFIDAADQALLVGGPAGSAATLHMSSGALYAYNMAGHTLQLGAGLTVAGSGTISQNYSASTLLNNGTIDADTAGATLTVSPSTLTNSSTGILRASAGVLTLSPTTFSNGGAVTVQAGTVNIAPTSWSSVAGSSINVNGGTVNLGGAFTFADINGYVVRQAGTTLNLTGTMDVQGGTLDIGASGPFGTGGLSSLSGTLRNTTLVTSPAVAGGADATLHYTGGATLNNVTIGTSLTSTGTSNVSGNLTLAAGVRYDIGNGTLYFTDDADQAVLVGGPAGSVATLHMSSGSLYAYNMQGHTLQLGAGLTVGGSGSIGQNYSASTLLNNGTVDADTAGSTLTINPSTLTNGSSGILRASAGALSITPTTFSNGGTVTVQGGTVSFVPTSWSSVAGSTINVNAGTLNLGGAFTVADISAHIVRQPGTTVNLTGNMDVQGTPLDIGASGPFGTGGLSSLSGTLTNATVVTSAAVAGGADAVLHYTGGATLNNVTIGTNLTSTGTTNVSGNLTLAAGVRYDIGNGTLYFTDVADRGILVGGPAGSVATLHMSNGAVYAYNMQGHTLQLGTGITVAGSGAIGQNYSASTLLNNGTIDADTAGSTLTIDPSTLTNASGGILRASAGTLSIVPTTFSNGGTVTVQGGTVSFAPTSWSSVTGSTINVNAGTLYLGGAFTLADITGHIARQSGTTVSVTGSLDAQGGTLDIGAAGPFGTGGLSSLSGALKNATLVSGDGSTLNFGGSANLNSVTIGGNLTSAGGASVTGNLTLAAGITFAIGNGTLSFTDPANQSILAGGAATLRMGGGGLYAYNMGGHTLQIGANVTVAGFGAISQNYSAATLLVNGTVDADQSGRTLTINTSTLTSNGTLRASAGTLYLTPGTPFANSALMETGTGGTIQMGQANLANNAGGIIRGTGTLNLGTYSCYPNTCADTLNNAGTIAGGMGPNGTGTLTIQGNLVEQAGSTVLVNLGGTSAGQYGQVKVTGTAALGGTLKIAEVGASVTGGFFADLGNAFPALLSATGGTTSSFSGISVPTDVSFTSTLSGTPGISNTTVSITRWASDANGDWNDPTQWTRGVPDAQRDAIISRPVAIPLVTVSGGTDTAHTLVLKAALDVTGGTLTLPASTLDGAGNPVLSLPVVLDGGTLVVPASVTAANALLTFNGGTLSSSGNLSAAGGIVATAGTWAGGGNATLPAGATLSKAGAGTFTIDQVLDNAGTLTVAGGSLVLDQASAQHLSTGTINLLGGTMTVQQSGTNPSFAFNAGSINVTNPTDFTVSAGVFDWGAGVLTGLNLTNGARLVLVGSGVKTLSGANITLNNLDLVGNLAIQSGSLTLNGTTTLPSGSSLTLNGGTFTDNGILDIGSGATFTKANPGTVTFSQAVNNDGTFNVNSGAVVFNGGGTDSGTFNVAAGTALTFGTGNTVLNDGAVINGTGTISMSGGTVTNNSSAIPVVIAPGTTLSLVNQTLTGPGTVTNNGTLDLTASTINNALLNNGNVVVGGSSAITGPTITWIGGTISAAGPGASLDAHAAALSLGSGGSRQISGVALQVASVDASGASLVLGGAGTTTSLTSAGPVQVGNGQSLTLSSATLNAPLNLGAGSSGLVVVGTNTVTGPITWSGGTITGTLATSTLNAPTGSLDLGSSGTRIMTGVSANLGGLSSEGASLTLNSASLVTAGPVAVGSGQTLTLNNAYFRSASGTLTNNGTLDLNASQLSDSLVVNGDVVVSGNNVVNGSAITWNSGAITGSGALSSSIDLGGSGVPLLNLGSGGTRMLSGVSLTVSSVALTSASLSLSNALLYTTSAASSATAVSGGQTLTLVDSTLSSTLSLQANAGGLAVGGSSGITGPMYWSGGTISGIGTGASLSDAGSPLSLGSGGSARTMTGLSATVGNVGGQSASLALVNSTLTSSGPVTMGSGQKLTLTNSTINGNVDLLGTLTGTGSVTGTLTVNGGVLEPGTPGSSAIFGTSSGAAGASAGGPVARPAGGSGAIAVLTVGNLVLAAGDNTTIIVNGAGSGQYDQIHVLGNATLAGALTLVDNTGGVYAPASGDHLGILSYASRSGDFSSLALPPGWQLTRADSTGLVALAFPASAGGGVGGGVPVTPAPVTVSSLPPEDPGLMLAVNTPLNPAPVANNAVTQLPAITTAFGELPVVIEPIRSCD